jgi:hypothetical protein
MDQTRFNALTRTVTSLPSRRDVLRSLAGSGIGFGFVSLPGMTEAKKKSKQKKGKKKRNKRPEPQPQAQPQPQPLAPLVFNQYGCVEVGQPCRGDANNCCSGICEGSAPAEGRPDSSRCIAHGTGICNQDKTGVCTALTDEVPTLSCGNDCYCFRTTAGSNFCAVPPAAKDDPKCADCKKDADCEALGFPGGSACIPVALGHCTGRCKSGMACLSPCGASPGP